MSLSAVIMRISILRIRLQHLRAALDGLTGVFGARIARAEVRVGLELEASRLGVVSEDLLSRSHALVEVRLFRSASHALEKFSELAKLLVRVRALFVVRVEAQALADVV